MIKTPDNYLNLTSDRLSCCYILVSQSAAKTHLFGLIYKESPNVKAKRVLGLPLHSLPVTKGEQMRGE